MLPTGGPVEAFGEEPGLVPFGFVALHGLIEQIFGHPFQARVAHQPERVGYALLFAVVVEGGHGEARVRPKLYGEPGPLLPQAADEALQEGHGRVGSVGVARPKERRDQVPRVPVENEQGVVHVLLEVAVVVGALLIAVGGVVGGIEVQDDLLRDAPFGSLPRVELEDGSGHPGAIASGGRILEA
jgi:hypothetical protein